MSKNTVSETPSSLVPKMGEFPVSNSSYYHRLFITDAEESGAEENVGKPINNAINPFIKMDDKDLPSKPATGVLLTFEQSWYQKGLALGELRHSLCLAPGEVTKVAVIDWRRQMIDQSAAETTQDESASSSYDDSQAIRAVQHAIAKEQRTGTSVSLSSSFSTEAGGSIGGIFGGASASTASSRQSGFAATSSNATKKMAASATKDIKRRTQELTQATRSRRATQVHEVDESESQSTTTRVVANYNHMHALTVQYYEVLQVYEMEVKTVGAQRCVFIPMELFDFTTDSLKDKNFIELLRSVVTDLGWTAIDKMLGNFSKDDAQMKKELDLLLRKQKEINDRWNKQINAFKKLPIMFPQVQVFKMAKKNELAIIEAAIDAHNIAASAEKERLVGILNDKKLLLNQQMWMKMDNYKWYRLLSIRLGPDNKPLGNRIDPTPIGYFGHYLAFPWEFSSDAAGEKEKAAFEKVYIDENARSEATVSLPTEGVFAEAVLGQSNSAEKIDITRFWNWQDSPIPILPPSMAPVATETRARDIQTNNIDLAPAVAKIREMLTENADVKDSVLSDFLKSAIFPEDTTMDAAKEGAGRAGKNASDGAGRAGQRAVDVQKNAQDYVVGLANSKVGEIAANAAVSYASGGVSTVGGLINQAKDQTKDKAK